MCGCFVVALGRSSRELPLALIWLFGDAVERAFNGD